tara:strand:+ start:129 stop:587 length:459 start_codon:yes stop_codon:yes gene_type:complete
MTYLAFEESGAITKWPIHVTDLQAKAPTVSFSLPLVAANLTDYGVVEITEEALPSFNSATQKINTSEPTKVDGTWKITSSVVALTSDELAANTARKAETARDTRNNLLMGTDWAAGSDLTMTDAMKTYRQNLRDVPTQGGFPDTITWPTKPS